MNANQALKDDVCLVTGGAGFIGCALSHDLADCFRKVVVFDNLHQQIHGDGQRRPAALDDRVELVLGDVSNAGDWDRLLAGHRPAVVVHLAAETGTAQSLTEASRHAIVNTVGTTSMLDAFGRNGHVPQHFVLASSRAVYGEGCWKRSTGETFYPGQRSHAQLSAGQWDFPGAVAVSACANRTHPSPSSIYGATKLSQEHILSAWALACGSAVSILRLQNVYGPGQSLNNPYTGIVPAFFRMAKAGTAIPLYEDGQIVRDFVFIDDVVSAILAASIARPEKLRVLDIGSGQGTTIRELAESVAHMYAAPAPVVTGQFRDGDVRAASCDIMAATQDIGWHPRVDMKAGLGQLKIWIDDKL
jgi:dTDP-L-rhamnose 4-epimerase